MKYLQENWHYVEEIGLPLLLGIMVLIFLSLFLYVRECRILRMMEREIDRKGHLKNLQFQIFFVYPMDLFYSMKSISTFGPEKMNLKAFKDQVEIIQGYRRIYRVLFPIVLSLVALAIAINEWLIDI